MSIYTKTPSRIFFNVYKPQIWSVREHLFSQLEAIAPEFKEEAKKLLEQKIKANNGMPSLGELFPWIIRDLTDITTNKEVTIGWLAVYLYTLFIDEFTDHQKLIKPETLITSSVVAKIGISNLSKVVKGTAYESIVDKALNDAALYQLEDVKNNSKKISLSKKQIYSKNKNMVLIACAGALAANDQKHSTFILSLTNSLLLAVQNLDDIADFEDDFKNSNFTTLLHPLLNRDVSSLLSKANSSNELLKELIKEGSLLKTITTTSRLLKKSLTIIEKMNFSYIEKRASFHFFTKIYNELILLQNLLLKVSGEFSHMTETKQNIVTSIIKKRITIIAQST